MSDGMLSQAEIDALLKGDEGAEEGPEIEVVTDNEGSIGLTDEEKDALGEIANISMGSAATALSALLMKKVEITTPTVSSCSQEMMREEYPRPYVLVEVKYKEGLKGGNLLVISEKDAAIIADLMMGGTGEAPVEQLGELHVSAVSEAMNQMMGSAATSMSTVFDRRIDISPPTADMVDLDKEMIRDKSDVVEDSFIKISFRLVIEDLVDSEMMQLIPTPFAKDLTDNLFAVMFGGAAPTAATPEPAPVVNEAPPPPPPVPEPQPAPVAAAAPPPREEPIAVSTPPPVQAQPVAVQPASFTQLSTNNTTGTPQNLDLILDVPLSISVELGRTTKSIRDILDFSAGSVVELDKLAGELVDMLVNGKLFARGEVVVIDENFGVRIKDIVSPMERIKNLQ